MAGIESPPIVFNIGSIGTLNLAHEQNVTNIHDSSIENVSIGEILREQQGKDTLFVKRAPVQGNERAD